MRYLAVAGLLLILPGCAAQHPADTAIADDSVCRSFMRNKERSDHTTYAECRKGLVDAANLQGYAPPAPNVTVIINH